LDKKQKKKAVALKYNPSMDAPQVIAKGYEKLADRIIEQNKDEIEIIKDPGLVEELDKIDIGQNIPPELYQVVAEVLLFIANLDKMQEYNNAKK
jgi:flagellar biosynthesis protein